MNEPLTPPRRVAATPALTTRLVAGYTLATLFILSLASLFLYRGLRRNFEIEDAGLLTDNVVKVRHEAVSGAGNLEGVEALISASVAERQLEKYYGRLLDEHGNVLLQTPGIETLLLEKAPFPEPAGPAEPVRALARWVSPSGVPTYLAAAWIDRGPNHPRLLYQLVLDARHLEEWLGGYRSSLLLVVALGTVTTAVLGWCITRGGLAPLRDITTSIQNVTADDLDEPLGERPWPQEVRALASEFDGMLQRLRRSFESLSRFSADVAHEFRTPLNNLVGATSLILSRDRSADDYRHTLEANLEEFERLNRMIERLLFLARADNAQMTMHKERVETLKLAQEVVDFFSALAEEKGVTLRVEGSTAVAADPTLLRQALNNLVSNAIRHTPAGGAVTITARPSDNGGAIFTVADTGPGIPAAHLPYIFDRFYHVDQSRSASGAGLGLALVKSVMQLHDGTSTVECEPGQGCRFSLEFPGVASGS